MACMESKRTEYEAPVQDCIDSVKAIFDEMKENIDDMKDQVDDIVSDMEKPECAKDWTEEDIEEMKEGVKETIKEEMTKPEEKRLASPFAYLSVAVPAVYSAMN